MGGVTDFAWHSSTSLWRRKVQRIRFRARARKILERDSDDPNTYRFGHRRWQNPDDAEDMVAIAKFWQGFRELAACTLEEMRGILRKALDAEKRLMVKRPVQRTA
eukprot:2269521-Rhodomonas_salina.1